MKHAKKLGLLVLILALLGGVFSVFASAANTRVLASYDGSVAFANAESRTEDNGNLYYAHNLAIKQSSIWPGINDLLGGDYGFFAWEMDFRTDSHFSTDSTTNIYTIINPKDVSSWATVNRLWFQVSQSSEDATTATLKFADQAITIDNLTEWHHFELIVELLPSGTGDAFVDNSVAHLFLDGKEVLTVNGDLLSEDAYRITEARIQTWGSDTDATFCFDNFKMTVYATGDYARADVNGTKYMSIAEAFAAANDGDTVTLYENMTEAVEIEKNLTVKTNGKTFLYRSNLCDVTNDGTTYTFAKDENPVTVEIAVGDNVTETFAYAVGAVPEILSNGTYTLPDNSAALVVTSHTVTVDGETVTDFTKITEDMRGKTVRITLVGDAAAFTVTTADGVTYVTDASFSALKNALAAASANAKITLYTDYTEIDAAAADDAGVLIFSAANLSFDLNGYTLQTISAKTSNYNVPGFLSIRANTCFFSSRKGGKVIAEQAGETAMFEVKTTNATLTIGADANGQVFEKENLTFQGCSFVQAHASAVTVNLNNLTYLATANGGNSALGVFSTTGTGFTVTMDGCDIFFGKNRIATSANTNWALFGVLDNGKTITATVTNSTLLFQEAKLVRSYWGNSVNGTMDITFGEGTVLLSSGVLAVDKNDKLETVTVTLADGVKLAVAQTGESFVTENENAKQVLCTPVEKTINGVTMTAKYTVTADYATLTFVDGKTSTAEVWAKGETPVKETVSLFGDYYKTYGTIAAVDGDATYTMKVRSTASKISGNLTLFANITFNLYFRNDGYIKGVSYNNGEVTKTFTDADIVTIGGTEYYLFKLDSIAPKDLSAAFSLDVVLDGTDETYSVMTSLVKYAASVLSSAESETGKTLVKALLDYVRETSVALGGVSEEFAGIKAIDACLEKYGYTRKTWTKPETVKTPAKGEITGAALELVSTPGFVFFLNDTYADQNSVTVTVNGVTKTYDITHTDAGKHYFTVDSIHISNYRKDLNVTLGEQSFTYNFDVYMAGFETVPDYANALYAYSVAAEAYLAAQNAD